MFRKIVLTILLMSCLSSASIFAVGLGEIEQSSGLNQPLKAEIPLLSAGDLAEYEILASLASSKEFEKIGVERSFFLNSFKFETVRDESGLIVIKITTHGVVKEPFLNFVVELNWPNGRILREYTLLLDPPIFDEISSTTIEQAAREAEPQASARRNLPSQSTPAEPRAPRSTFEPSETGRYTGSTWGPVSNTDTLWRIATNVRPDRSVSIQQTLVAIYRANPNAFSNGNINNLKQGQILNIPDLGVIRNIPHRAALQDVVMQNRQWRSGGARKIVSRGDTSGSGSSGRSGGSRLSLATENSSGSAEGFGSDAAEVNQIRNQLNRSQEESATLQAENEALRVRLAEILEQAESAGGSVVNVEDAELAALAQTTEADKLQGEELTTDEVDPDSDNATGSNENTAEADLDDEAGDEPPVDAEKVEDTVADPDPQKASEPQAKEKGLVEKFLENDMLLWGSVGTVVVIFFFLIFWRMKKRMQDDDFQDDLVASAGAGSMDTTQTFELPDVGDDMLVELDMDDDGSSTGNADEAFDPLGEADIYIAYGKYEQAQNLLIGAIEDNPVRADLKVKLMECYAETDEKEKFDALALEVSEAVDADDWQEQVVALRTQAWESDAGESKDGSDEVFDLPSTEDIFGDDDDDDDELDVDFSDDDASTQDAKGSRDTSVGASDDILLNDLDDQEEDFSKNLGDSADELDDLEGLDDVEGLDDLDDLDVLDGDDDFNLDSDTEEMDDGGENSFDSDDEIATKLDLARAYVDMGDSDGAKEILEEVIASGTDKQKSEAQSLIDKSN